MNLLSIETATEACSAALSVNGEVIESWALAPREHTRLILSQVDEVLAQAELNKSQLDGLCFSRGPGAFTGVRIGTSVAQAIALGLGLPVLPVSTLAILAQGKAAQAPHVLAAIDARMSELYVASFVRNGQGIVQLQGDESVLPEAEVVLPTHEHWYCTGTGFAAAPELAARFGSRLLAVDAEALPHAADAISLALPELLQGKGLPPEQALPVYVRDRVVQKPGAKT